MTSAYINGKAISLDPSKSKGKGGEADIFEFAPGQVAKIFKQPNHPDFTGDPKAQKAARERIAEHQKKLLAFPKGLPANVTHPLELVKDSSGHVLGYSMNFRPGEVLFRFSERQFRQTVPNTQMVKILESLYKTVDAVHHQKVIIGDFNDLNVLVNGEEVGIIDADSMQFGSFLCSVFTDKFVDPTLCDPSKDSPLLCKPHNENSDWYAFCIMFMQSFLFVGPYGGVYKPKDISKRVPHSKRPLSRITVFNSEVQYPKPAIPLHVLPDALLHHLYEVFEKDKRGKPDWNAMNLAWTTCTVCGTNHAKSQCPNCKTQAPAAVKTAIQYRGKVSCERVFKTSGVILAATVQGAHLHYLYHENGGFLRENGNLDLKKSLTGGVRYRISGKSSLMAKMDTLIVAGASTLYRYSVATLGSLSMFDANSHHFYWAQGNQLVRNNGMGGSEYIGDILQNQTLFWVGETFGFGFYRAGNLFVAFVFDANQRGINDSVSIPGIKGQLVDSTCFFTSKWCWFFVALQQGGKTIHECHIIASNGALIASARAEKDDGSWLGGDIRGKCAMGEMLFSSTDDGIVRVGVQGNQITQTQAYPDTEPFVEEGNPLLPGPGGIYVVSEKEINLIKIA